MARNSGKARWPSFVRRAGAVSAVITVATAAPIPAAVLASDSPPEAVTAAGAGGLAAAAGPFVTLLFSRSEITAADGCIPDNAAIARLDSTVAPFLRSLGMPGTGTLVTGRTYATRRNCVHYGSSLTASWADATTLARNDGWSFVSHTADYPGPAKLASLTPKQADAETCKTVAAITAHGLPGASGMIAYPGGGGAWRAIGKLQEQHSQYCFAWGRQYQRSGVTDASAASTPPYWQHTAVVHGGHCRDPLAACYRAGVHWYYLLPSTIIARIKALRPGQWFTLQAFVLVTGRNPAYTHNRTRWDCSSPNPAEHWTNDEERYCWSDYQQIIRAIAAIRAITVTDPLTVGTAFGRPFTRRPPPIGRPPSA